MQRFSRCRRASLSSVIQIQGSGAKAPFFVATIAFARTGVHAPRTKVRGFHPMWWRLSTLLALPSGSQKAAVSLLYGDEVQSLSYASRRSSPALGTFLVSRSNDAQVNAPLTF